MGQNPRQVGPDCIVQELQGGMDFVTLLWISTIEDAPMVTPGDT